MKPALLAGTVIVAVTGLTLWTIFSLNEGPPGLADAESGSGQVGGAADILANAPIGNEITAYHVPAAPRVILPMAPTQPPAPITMAPAAVAPDMTETAIAGRKAAWTAHYATLADRDRQRIDNQVKAMQADTEVEASAGTDKATSSSASLGQTGSPESPKDFFQQATSSPSTDYSPYTLTDPISPYEVKATDQITAKLITQLNSDSRGILKAIVTKPVLDHATGHFILIPQGSTLVGFYDTTIAYGQTRVTTVWTRILYPGPCNQSLDLGAMPGSDQTGQAGFEDLTNNHLAKIFTSAVLVSIFGAAAQLSQPSGNAFQSYNPAQTAAGAVGQQTSQLGSELARKGVSIAPTEQVRAGYNFGIFLTKDIAFSQPWIGGICNRNAIEGAQQ